MLISSGILVLPVSPPVDVTLPDANSFPQQKRTSKQKVTYTVVCIRMSNNNTNNNIQLACTVHANQRPQFLPVVVSCSSGLWKDFDFIAVFTSQQPLIPGLLSHLGEKEEGGGGGGRRKEEGGGGRRRKEEEEVKEEGGRGSKTVWMFCTSLSLLHLSDVKLLGMNLVSAVPLPLFSVDPQRMKHLGLRVCTPEALRIM